MAGPGPEKEATGEVQARGDRRPLSAREVQVVELIVQGYSAKEVAETLSLSHRTVERHIENVRTKLQARNRPHLVSEAIASGQISVFPQLKK